MKICAITMVYKDYWALSQWYAHYSLHLGPENLFVVSHGYDARISELCPLASVITIPRDDLSGFDRVRANILNSFQDGLGMTYDWVIRTDVDELICLDPSYHQSFASLFEQQKGFKAIFALGLDVVEDIDEVELGKSDSVFQKRRNAVFSGHYSKAWAVKRGTHLAKHGIRLSSEAAFNLPRGVYLAHLKFANIAALAEINPIRKQVAQRKEHGLPGKAWRAAGERAIKVLSDFEKFEEVDWTKAEAKAYEAVSKSPLAEKRYKVLRVRSISFKERTKLPEWFK